MTYAAVAICDQRQFANTRNGMHEQIDRFYVYFFMILSVVIILTAVGGNDKPFPSKMIGR